MNTVSRDRQGLLERTFEPGGGTLVTLRKRVIGYPGGEGKKEEDVR